jgi:hypothetical protein
MLFINNIDWGTYFKTHTGIYASTACEKLKKKNQRDEENR